LPQEIAYGPLGTSQIKAKLVIQRGDKRTEELHLLLLFERVAINAQLPALI